jgi:hypothetical protein
MGFLFSKPVRSFDPIENEVSRNQRRGRVEQLKKTVYGLPISVRPPHLQGLRDFEERAIEPEPQPQTDKYGKI